MSFAFYQLFASFAFYQLFASFAFYYCLPYIPYNTFFGAFYAYEMAFFIICGSIISSVFFLNGRSEICDVGFGTCRVFVRDVFFSTFIKKSIFNTPHNTFMIFV